MSAAKPFVNNVLEIIESEIRMLGGRAYLAGGAVRDTVLGRQVYDYDIVLKDARIISREIFNSISDMPEITVTPVFMGERKGRECFRLVFRIKYSYREPMFWVDFMEMNGDSIVDDLQNRDFTVNAMALPLEDYIRYDELKGDAAAGNGKGKGCNSDECSGNGYSGDAAAGIEDYNSDVAAGNGYGSGADRVDNDEGRSRPVDGIDDFSEIYHRSLIDLYGGLQDIREKQLRAVTDTIFQDDPLRLWRMWRFAAELDFSPCGELLQLALVDGHRAPLAAGERVRREIMLLLSHPRGAARLARAAETGLLEQQFPGLAPLKGCEQGDYHHLDARAHSITVMTGIEEIIKSIADIFTDQPAAELFHKWLGTGFNLAVLKLAGLFHDIGKPLVRETDEQGQVRFFGHEKAGLPLINDIAAGLSLSRRERELLIFLTAEHLRIITMVKEAAKSTRRRYWNTYGRDMPGLLILAVADMQAKKGPRITRKATKEFIYRGVPRFVEEWLYDFKPLAEAAPLATGRDIMEHLNIPSGPAVGRIKGLVREAQAEGQVITREDALQLASMIYETGDRGQWAVGNRQ